MFISRYIYIYTRRFPGRLYLQICELTGVLVCDCPYMLVVMPAWLPAYLPVCLSCLALSCLVLSLRVFCLVLPYLVWSCRVRCLVLTCLVRFCPGLPFLSTCLSARCIFTNIACEVLTAAICYVPCLWTTRTLTQRVASKQVFRHMLPCVWRVHQQPTLQETHDW